MVLPKNAQGGSLDETAIVDIVSTKNDATYVITSGGTAGKINTLTKATALPNVNKATCLSYDSKLGEIFIGSSNNTIYSVADDVQVGAISLTDNVPAADIQLPASDFPMTKMFAANGIIAYGTSGGGVYVISAESYDNSGTNYVWTENNSFVSVSFKSPGLASGSPKAYTSYVYNVNISGIPLTSNQMFLQGYNGFWYELSNDNGQYKTTVFPVSGLRYAENPQTLTATLTPNPTTVQWAGPICSSFGQDHITVTQCTFDFINNKRVVISKSVIDLIPINDNFITNINKIATATGSSSNSNNIPISDSGVCGVPLQVTLMSGVTNIDKNDPAYDRLTFYYTQSSGVNDGTLIGSDSLVTILPSSFATIDNNAIKYGKFKTTSSVVGRVYYIYSNLPKGTAFTVNVHLAPSSASGTMITQGLAFNTCSATLTAAQVSVPGSLSGNIAVSYYPNEDASSGIQITNLSNWANPKYPGYIDYLFYKGTDSSSNTEFSFVAGLMPEGLNTRTLDERMKMGALGDYGNSFVGYYLKPLSVSAGSGDSNPIGATSYSMVATTSNCHAMINQPLYAHIFDEYGARYEFTVTDSNTVAGKDKDGNNLTWSACDSTTKTAGVRMELASLYPLPLVVASNTKLPSVGVTSSGIYMPPGTYSSNGLGSYKKGVEGSTNYKDITTVGYTYLPYIFLSDIPICIDGTSNDGTYGLNIYSVSSVSPVASSSVKIQEINMDNYNLTVQNSNLTPATNFPSVTRITNFKQIDADFRWRAWGTFVFGTPTQEGMLANQFPIVNDDETIIWYYYPVGGNSKRVAWQCIKNFDGQISVNEASVTTSIFTKSASTNTYITAGAPDDIAADFYIDKSDSGSGVFTDK